MKKILFLALCFLLNACVFSTIPLSPFAPLPADDPLIGTWIKIEDNAKEKEINYLHIGNQGEGLQMVSVTLDSSGRIKNEPMQATSTTMNGQKYLSVLMPEEDKKLYYILKYRVDGDTLTLWAPDFDFIKTAIEQKQIAGSAKSKSYTVEMSADQPALQRFFIDNDSKIFQEKPAVLKRLKL